MAIVKKFYEAFSIKDVETMVAFYDRSIIFEDPAFGKLHGEQAKNMWRMLLHSQKEKSFKVVASKIRENSNEGTAYWEASYNFGKQKRKVHNRIEASFIIKNGKIIKHTDSFDLYKWSRQAFGITGTLIGWTPYFKKKLRTQILQRLASFEAKQT